MRAARRSAWTDERSLRDRWRSIRRAFAEFLALPTAVIAAFLVLAVVGYLVDLSEVGWLQSSRTYLRRHVFADAEATTELLATIAGSIITVTSITFSLLLLAVQQSAAALTSQVFDQFLRRRLNQFYFGFFVGLALYCLVLLATVGPAYNPVFGATLAFLLTVVALYFLVVLIYSTIDQARPAVVIASIHDLTLSAWQYHRGFVRATGRSARGGPVTRPVRATRYGYVTAIDLDALTVAVRTAGGDVEIVLCIEIGSFVAYGDPIGEVSARSDAAAAAVAEAVQPALTLEPKRDIERDPAYGIEQLVTIGWSSISTAKSNPTPGILTIQSLRDILARWSVVGEEQADPDPAPVVVYTDSVLARLLDAFESLAVITTESMQHQALIEVLRALTVMFDRVPVAEQRRIEDIILRLISGLGDHVLTATLEEALRVLID